MQTIASDGPKWDPRCFFPTNPDLADILGRTDLSFENLNFLCLFFGLQISGFRGPQISKTWPGPGWANGYFVIQDAWRRGTAASLGSD